MKYFFLLLVPLASAFVILPLTEVRPVVSWRLATTNTLDAGTPFPLGFDKERAIECAEKFGKCSLEEVKDLRDSIHDARVKTMLLSNLAGGSVHVEDTLFQELLLEEDLSLQLSLLGDEMPETKANVLFPIEATMHPERFEEPEVTTVAPALTWMDENLSDAMAICVVISILAFAPQLLHY